MIVLIAESKAMSDMCGSAAPTAGVTEPMFLPMAEAVMDGLRGRGVAQLGSEFKMGPKNAQRLYEEIYDFPNRTTGARAVDAFTGVVFKSLDAASLPAPAREAMEGSVRIVSSLYGLLRPSDLIKSYRLDFGMKAAPGNRSLAAYWRPTLTQALLDELARTGETEILNLLPADASKCFNWKEIAPHASVATATFKQLGTPAAPSTPLPIRTPHSDHLKRLRGRLLRLILTTPLPTFASLRTLALPDLTFSPDHSTPSLLTYLVSSIPNETTLKAMDDAANGNTIKCGDFNGYLKLMSCR